MGTRRMKLLQARMWRDQALILFPSPSPWYGFQWVTCSSPWSSAAGPSGINNFNPGIFGTEFCKNPGIPGFSGSGLASIFNPGIV